MGEIFAQTGQTAGSTAEFWVFWILAPISLAAAVSVVLLRNTVHAALMLVVNFFTIAVFYAVLEAQFLAIVQIIVYAGAIMVLFLFVLMLLGVWREQAFTEAIRGQKTSALLLGLLLLVGLTAAVGGPYLGRDAVCPAGAAPETAEATGGACTGLAEANAANDGNVRGVGFLLFTRYVWPFEVMSVLLVIAAIGAMVLGRKREDPDEGVDRPESLTAMEVRR